MINFIPNETDPRELLRLLRRNVRRLGIFDEHSDNTKRWIALIFLHKMHHIQPEFVVKVFDFEFDKKTFDVDRWITKHAAESRPCEASAMIPSTTDFDPADMAVLRSSGADGGKREGGKKRKQKGRTGNVKKTKT